MSPRGVLFGTGPEVAARRPCLGGNAAARHSRQAAEWLGLSFALAILCVVLSACSRSKDVEKNPEFAGSTSCRECHERFYELWAPSHHGLAMQPYGIARKNLTPQTAEIKIGNSRFQADIEEGVVVERGPRGEVRHAVGQVLGGKNVFYFLTPLERGRLQVLPVAYDVHRREWFDTPASSVRHFASHPDEALRWTEPAYTFNTSCFSCHVSQLTNNYDLATDTYSTTWGEPGINCETCHGPASAHIRAARSRPQGQPLKDLKIISLKSFGSEQINSLCGACHARIYPLTSSFAPGELFFDHFGLTALESLDFYPDGRELGEDFTYTSWRLSPCLKSGKLNCVTCHTSSGRYRFAGEQTDSACLPCHQDKVANAVSHSRHKAGSAGAHCVSCHMPRTEFARMIRSDHSMRPPMPAATIAFGSPNACNICHTNETAQWADQQVRAWHADDYEAPTLLRASWIAAARKGDWSKLAEIVRYLAGNGREEIWAASLIQLLRPCQDPSKWNGIVPCLSDPSALVRAAAVEAMADRPQPEIIAPLSRAAGDKSRLVRLRAAAALAGAPPEMIPTGLRESVFGATAELLSSFQARPDTAASHHNLGNFYLERREEPQAIAAFETALKLQPDDISSLVNAALAYNMAGENDTAEARLRHALQLSPTNADINLNLGMLLAEMGKMPEAENAFRTTVKSDPRSAQAAFNLGVLLSKTRPEEALDWCRRAAELRPEEPRYAYTLAFFQHDQSKDGEAIQTLSRLIDKSPPDPSPYALLIRIHLEGHRTEDAVSVCRRAASNEGLSEAQRAQFVLQAQTLEGEGGRLNGSAGAAVCRIWR